MNNGSPDPPIRCFTRRVSESGAALFFQEKVLDKQPYGATTTVAESWGTIIKVCSTATDFPIGIAHVIPALAAAGSIKIVGVKGDVHASGVKPSDETLRNKTYQIFLTFRYYWDEKTVSDQAKKFVEFCASKGSPSQEYGNRSPRKSEKSVFIAVTQAKAGSGRHCFLTVVFGKNASSREVPAEAASSCLDSHVFSSGSRGCRAHAGPRRSGRRDSQNPSQQSLI